MARLALLSRREKVTGVGGGGWGGNGVLPICEGLTCINNNLHTPDIHAQVVLGQLKVPGNEVVSRSKDIDQGHSRRSLPPFCWQKSHLE